jgi:hypothetical protein
LDTQLIALVLDELIPPRPDRNLPGAGALGIGALVEQAAAASPEVGPALTQGFNALEDLARRSDQKGFGALSRTARVSMLKALESAEPTFIPTLLTLACVGYYSNEQVLVALNGEARPPHPNGYTLEPDDWSLLEPVRARPKLYREC